jgi:hypothetical protein
MSSELLTTNEQEKEVSETQDLEGAPRLEGSCCSGTTSFSFTCSASANFFDGAHLVRNINSNLIKMSKFHTNILQDAT